MPVLGWLPEYVSVDDQALSEDRPVSVWPSLILQSNIQHIITQKPQTRVAWRSSVNTTTDRDGWIVDNTEVLTPVYEVMFHQLFELSWIKEDRPTGLYVELYGMADNIPAEIGSVTVRLRVVPANSPTNDLAVEPVLNFSGTLLADTDDSLVFADWIKPEPNATLAGSFIPLTDAIERLEGDIHYFNPYISLMRAEVLLTATEGTTRYGVTGLIIREFWT